MKKKFKWRLKAQRALKTTSRILQVAGYFRHRGVTIWHPGLLVDQPGIVRAIDDVIQILTPHYGEDVIEATLARVTLRYYGRPILTGAGWAGHDARWTGGMRLFEKGVAKIHYDEEWASRTRTVLAALLTMEMPSPERQEEEEAAEAEMLH